jgi:beta-galactosidase/beta-glucuronidase
MDKIPRPEYPRPQFERAEWVSLNGVWQFEMDPGRSGMQRGLPEAEKLSGEILVPFPPESELSGVGYKDFIPAVWYRRTFQIPEDWKDKRILLHFEAVDYKTHVWVNGREVGFHRGGYTPFTFEITDLVRKDGNTLVVYVEDDTRSPLQPTGKQSAAYHSHGCVYTRTTGIWQTVWLEAVPQTYIARVRMIPNLEGGSLFVTAELDGPETDTAIVAKTRIDGDEVLETRVDCPGNKVFFMIVPPEVRAWSPEDPFLYEVIFELEKDGETLDRVKSYFGLRSIAVKGPAVLLNGKPLFQRLILDQGFYPDGIYTAPSDEALRRDIELAKAMGFNGARLHQKVFERRFLYWADKLGYLLWGEFPNWGLDHAHPEALERFLTEWLTVLERDMNHPSIVGWCPFNETPANQNPEFIRTVYRVTKQIDPTRPVIDTSGYTHVETDLYDVHCYDQNPESFAARFKPLAEGGEAWRNRPDRDAPYRGQPYWVSEYGGTWWNPDQKDDKAWGYGDRPKSEEEFLERYRRLTETLLNHPRMCGFCYTQLYDIEQEVNGLYTYDRRPKFDPERIRAINSQRAAIERDYGPGG